MREVWKRIGAGEQEAREAMDIYLHRLVKYVGAYTAVMGGPGRADLHRRYRRERREPAP